uniref:Delta(3)-Delta(2)-enoyl-CoA isomerase n=1 Tax=Kalanchoe fedtschenkoi TaxID=63787 RepID=A0A7N0V750_KALFE
MCSVEKRGGVYLLTLTGDGEHRINPTLIRALKSALQQIKSDAESSPSSTALVTTGQGKFFSNGYDLDWVRSPNLSPAESESRAHTTRTEYASLIQDLISFPMPTIAAVTGHASAAGFVLALAHDYVVMRRDRGFLYMSEVDIDLVVPPWFVALVKSKVGSGLARRDVFMRAEKLTGAAAVEKGVVDSAHDGAEATVEAGLRLGEELVKRKWKGHVYAGNRMVVMSEVLQALASEQARVAPARL